MAAAEPSSSDMASPRFEGLRAELRHISAAFPDVDALLGRNDFEGAWKLLRAAVDASADNGPAHFGLALALEVSGDLVGALSHAEEAAKLMPEDIAAWRLMARLAREEARQQEQRLLRARASVSQLRTQLKQGEHEREGWIGARARLEKVRAHLARYVNYSDSVPIRIFNTSSAAELARVERDNFTALALHLEQLGFAADGTLLRGMSKALELDPYEAAGLFYRWLRTEGPAARLALVVPQPNFLDTTEPQDFVHGLTIHVGGGASGVEERCDALLRFVELNRLVSPMFATKRENRALIMAEAAMMAVARYYGAQRQPERVIDKISEMLDREFGWASGVRTVHLQAIRHALELIRNGEEVPPHLRKFVGDDDGYLKARICSHPFTRIDLLHGEGGLAGSVPTARVCCVHWLPTVIGKLSDGPEAIVNSAVAQDIRRSMLDGSFKYCDHLNCQAMPNDQLPLKTEVIEPVLRKAIDTGAVLVDGPSELLFAIDDSCNLSCPSCRVEVRGASQEENKALMEMVEQTVLPMLRNVSAVMINPAGEVMVSEPSRAVLRYISDETTPNLKVRIITNGTRFSEEEWAKFPGIHNKVEYIRVSLDAARKETFEKLRRGASYEETWRNLRFLSRLRKARKIDGLFLSFTYQRDNFREMPEFVQMGLDLDVDGVMFERLMNMGAFTNDEYRERAVHLSDHGQYPEFQRVLEQPLLKNFIVRGDLASVHNASSYLITDTSQHVPGALVWHAPLLTGTSDYHAEGARLDADPASDRFGELQCDMVTEDGTTGYHRIELVFPKIRAGECYVPSLWLKPQGRSHVRLEMRDATSSRYGSVDFDLRKKKLSPRNGDVVEAGIIDEGGGWYRIWASMPFDAAPAVYNLALMDIERPTYQGDGVSGLFVRELALACGERPAELMGVGNTIGQADVLETVWESARG